jgi:hypothetical protein
MTKPTIRIYTSVDEFIDREMTDEEFTQYQIDSAKAEAAKAEAEAKAQAKAELLERLGLTQEEFNTLTA